MWCLQYTINYIYSKIRWDEEEAQRYYTIVVDEDKVQSTKKCLEFQKKKFRESRYWDSKKKKWLVKFKVYYATKRMIPKLPEYKGIYDELRKKLLKMWTKTGYAAHYVDSIIQWAYRTVMRGWRELYEEGRARKKKPVMKRRTIYIKNTLFRVRNGELVITLVPRKHYLRVPLEDQWFLERVEGYRLGAVLIKELSPREKYRIILQYTKKREEFQPRAYISIDLNMDTVDLLLYVPRTKIALWIQIDWSELIQWIREHSGARSRVQSRFSHARRKNRRRVLRKLSTRYHNYTDDVIKKMANFIVWLAKTYNAIIIVEDLKKQAMYNGSKRRNRELGFRLWKRLITYIKGQWHTREVNPYKTTKTCSICGSDTIVQGLQVYCPKCRKTINRQLNACINIMKKTQNITINPENIKRETISIKDIL